MVKGIRKGFKELNPHDYLLSIFLFILGIILGNIPLLTINKITYPSGIIVGIIVIIGFVLWICWYNFSTQKYILDSPVMLSDPWFKEKYEKFVEPSRDKFSFEAELYTKTNVHDQVHQFLLDDTFLLSFKEWHNNIKNDWNDFNHALTKLDTDLPQRTKWISQKLELLRKAEEIKITLNEIMENLSTVNTLLKNQNFEKIKKFNFQGLYDDLKKIFREYEKLERKIDFSKIKFTGNKEEIYKTIKNTQEIISEPSNITLKFLNDLNALIIKLKVINEIELHILGDAGVGKSYIVTSICKERLEKGLPTLIVSGRDFSKDSLIEKQLRTLLDIESFSWHDFLDALDKVADSKNTRIPIIIDGLNETTFDSSFSNLWKSNLNRFVHDLKSKKNIVLITTCRTTYKEVIWNGFPENYLHVRNFSSTDVETARKKYFDFYKIEAKPTATPLNQFKNPLYLRIFGEVTNPDRKKKVKISLL